MHRKLLYWLFFLLLAVPTVSLARAGGGGGGGGHGGGGGGGHGGGYSGGWHGGGGGTVDAGSAMLMLLVFGFIIFYFWRASTSALRAKQRAAEQLLAKLAQEDALWNLKHMTARVAEVYFKVQAAWTANNQELARDCLSAKLYDKHKAQTDWYLAHGQRNVLEEITLQDVAIYSVSDHKNDARDTFSARIRGSMIDYLVNRQGGFISGNTSSSEGFTETWRFVRVDNAWVLDRISPSPSPSVIERGVTYSHKARRKSRTRK